MKIISITASEILDSRGNPTVSAVCELENGALGQASVPSGASTGAQEAKELRDGGKRYMGMGVLTAVERVNTTIRKNLVGKNFDDQISLDKFLCNLDGTPKKSFLGANAILAVSMSFARAMAIAESKELFEYLSFNFSGKEIKKFNIPTPMFNILNGGEHSSNNIDIQETMIVPIGFNYFRDKLRAGSEIYHYLKNMLINSGYDTSVGDEGGFAPNFLNNEDILKNIEEAIEKSGYSKGKVRISLDVAANSFYQAGHDIYYLAADEKHITSLELINLLSRWSKKYKLFSIEDGLNENDKNWAKLTLKISPTLSIGDDLFVTDENRIGIGANNNLANGTIIKLNQIGTVSEAFMAVKKAKKEKMKVIVSHRSGETEDSFIADFSVACRADFIKSGAPARSERLAKYNRLIRIEELLNSPED